MSTQVVVHHCHLTVSNMHSAQYSSTPPSCMLGRKVLHMQQVQGSWLQRFRIIAREFQGQQTVLSQTGASVAIEFVLCKNMPDLLTGNPFSGLSPARIGNPWKSEYLSPVPTNDDPKSDPTEGDRQNPSTLMHRPHGGT